MFYIGAIACNMKFIVMDPEVTDLEYEEGMDDEYALNDFEITLTAFLSPASDTNLGEFKTQWKEAGKSKFPSSNRKFALQDIEVAQVFIYVLMCMICFSLCIYMFWLYMF